LEWEVGGALPKAPGGKRRKGATRFIHNFEGGGPANDTTVPNHLWEGKSARDGKTVTSGGGEPHRSTKDTVHIKKKNKQTIVGTSKKTWVLKMNLRGYSKLARATTKTPY